MPVMIRLARQGAKKKPQFLVVAVDKMKKRDGEYLDRLGHYFPKEKDPKKKIKMNMEKLAHWKSKGALTTRTVGQLLIASGNGA